ncbi:sugar porter family MFS transporter [Alicyclobacillus fastidiosus]|uniref:Sugar porter family MFS transporter n=1 Tax=Alicyclobacillus fastidiosus TaxID=392011 RepID=A0ABY6ZN30_9BACL|nr:sugar porter family MFS transporter [Alicyclobacillus fastidiosus]WAH43852.1 sugar porter family MFS transporter [Alicyclobacillus fastidiosus]GMA60089.1 arabinose-proton symporter [Alicyclobacillus fastidiosus]
MSSPQKASVGFVTLVSVVAAIGGLLFGYDTAVISGATPFMQVKFDLGPGMIGWAVSCLMVGAIIGAGFAGTLSDRFGRKKMLVAAAILFSIGSVGSALASTIAEFVVARIIGGVGIGVSSTLVPLYIAEIAPTKHRGRLVSLNQLAVVIGISAIYFVNRMVVNAGTHTWDVNTGWRWMFGLGVVPGIIFMALLFTVPESPRWLEKQGKSEVAQRILQRVNGTEAAMAEIAEIRHSLKAETGTIAHLFKPGFRIALLVGVIIAILQQVTGINAIMYYAPEIFKQTGAGTNSTMTETIIVGLVNLVFTLVSLWLIDKVGRKVLLLIGSAVMAISLFIIGYAFHSGHTGTLVLILILLFVAAFAVSFGPIVWLIIAEIFPTRVRGRATAVASVALWAADYLVSQMFPILLNGAGAATTFWVFCLMSAFSFCFTLWVVPETKGKSLEQIEQSWSAANEPTFTS